MKLRRFYLTLDLRSLGVFRVLLAGHLIVDWFTRWPVLADFYTEQGAAPNSLHLAHLGHGDRFSILTGISSLPAVQFWFLVALVCDFGLLLGIRTRFFQVAALALYLGIVNRGAMISSVADEAILTFGLWALFLPLGKRFALDALLARKPGSDTPDANRCAPSLAAFAFVLQLGIAYTLTGLAKSGELWRNGTAAYYVMQSEFYATRWSAWVGDLPGPAIAALTHGVRWLEILGAPLILLPWLQPHLRRVFMLGMGAFHLGSALTMKLGMIPWAFLVTFVVLWGDAEWRLVERAVAAPRWSNWRRRAGRLRDQLAAWLVRVAPEPRWPESWPARDRVLRLAANGLVGVLLAAVLVDTCNQHVAWAKSRPRLPEPGWMRALVHALGTNTTWTMFSPDPWTSDGWWVANGKTQTGESIDPLTNRPPTWTKPATLRARSPYWTRYLLNLSMPANHDYRTGYARYLVRRSHRASSPGRRLESFDFYYVEERTLPPGSPRPFPARPLYMWSYDVRSDRVGLEPPAVTLATPP